jgi:hypothetical protein
MDIHAAAEIAVQQVIGDNNNTDEPVEQVIGHDDEAVQQSGDAAEEEAEIEQGVGVDDDNVKMELLPMSPDTQQQLAEV